ncbi:39S ribosomal protein L46 mitochondrial-like isoform X1 [Biomphalaria glabrata]|nr:39S ribosomal protein L46; mitochondrial-like isoform X1 [Biomphalaria glabrata]
MALRHRHVIKTLSMSSRLKLLQNSGTKKFESKQLSTAHPKNLIGAVCIERYPVITATKTKLEERFSNLLSQIELEKSHYSDHEVRLMREKKNVKSKTDEEETHAEAQTGLDLEDKWDAELKAFQPASRETEADRKKDRQSLERQLDSCLYLVMKQNINGKDHWILPQISWQEGENLRQTAERALASIGGNIKATFLGNAPCGVAKFEPDKIFFFKAWYRDGQVILNKDFAKDYLWLTRNELSQYCFPTYSKNIKKFIPPF